MDQDLNPLMFTDTVEFAGIFFSGALSAGPFSIEVKFSQTHDHPPHGIIRGTSDDYERLEQFFYRSSAPQRLVSASEADGRERFVAERIIIRSISNRHYPSDEATTVHQVIGAFDALDFTIIRNVQAQLPRSMVFLLESV